MPSIEIPRRCTGIVPKRQTLTARTRNNEVLPAFCKPIMVMSISVALRIDKGGRQFHIAVGTIFAFSWYKFARQGNTWRTRRVENQRNIKVARKGQRTRTGVGANHRCVERSRPFCQGRGLLALWSGGCEVCSANWLEELSR